MTELEMTGLLVKLANEGVTGLLVTYSGGGDSGAIDDIVYTTDKLDEDDEIAIDQIDSIDTYSPNAKYLRALSYSMNDDLNDFLSQYILDGIEDWWNNDGGYGKVSILVPSGKYKINNSIYITHTEDYTHEGDLLSQTEE
jgi:hypothetical protein